jgi:hypothetical protein
VGDPVATASLLATDAMVVLVASLDVWAGQLVDVEQRHTVRTGIRVADSQIRELRRRLHLAAGRSR